MNTHDTLLFQGDSITDCGRGRDVAGPNKALGSGYAMMIAGSLLKKRAEDDLKFLNRGISGNRVVDLYARWKIDCLNLRPDALSILIGVNDTWHEMNRQNGVEPERYGRIYRELLDWTLAELPDIRLILCEPFVLLTGAVTRDWVDEMDERRAIVRQLAADFNAVFVPFQDAFDQAVKRAPADYWLGDGVHPTYAGHVLMTETWLQAVKE